MEYKTKITYLTSSHHVNDDRIYYHIKDSLEKKNCEVSICSCYGIPKLTVANSFSVDGEKLSFHEKKKWFYEQLLLLKPEIVICGEPLPILAAKKYKKEHSCKIIYDVTEWYPSKKNLENLMFVKRWVKFGALFSLNVYASFFVDGFIVGEYHKKRLYDFLYPLKPKEIISYYPKKKYVSLKVKQLEPTVFKIGYSGKFSKEKGLHRVFKVADILRKENPSVEIILVLIGKTYSKYDTLFFKSLIASYPLLNIQLNDMVSFEDFSTSIANFDVALDLRDDDWENTRCLPIKVFHYNACGIPVVYSDLDAINKGYVKSDFCKLLPPDNINKIAEHLQGFIVDAKYYNNTSLNAIKEIEKNYLWEHLERRLFDFIQKIKA